MDQQEKRPSAVPVVFSVIALVFSALALICAIVLIIISDVGPESGSATALTNRAVLTVSGMIFFTGFTWLFAMIGGLIGFIMTIVDIVVKRVKIIWIPVSAMVLGITSMILSTVPF